MARPHGLTPERHLRIVEQIRRGAYYTTTASYVGISEKTMHTWLTRGYNEQQRIDTGSEPSETETPFRLLSQDVQEAQAYAELYAMDKWRDAIPTDWRAAKEFLALRFPDKWASNRDRGEVTVTQAPSALVGADARALASVVEAVIEAHVPAGERAAAVETARAAIGGLSLVDVVELSEAGEGG